MLTEVADVTSLRSRSSDFDLGLFLLLPVIVTLYSTGMPQAVPYTGHVTDHAQIT